MCSGGRGVFVAEIRYKHDLVRLCHKFYFCPFQMKMPHIDEEKELYALPIQGSVQDFLLRGGGGGGGVDPRKVLEPRVPVKFKFFWQKLTA